MRIILTAAGPAPAGRNSAAPLGADILVEVDPGAAVSRLAAALDPLIRTSLPEAGVGPRLFLGDRELKSDKSISEAGLFDGAVVSVGKPAPVFSAEPPAVLEIRVVSGPEAGMVHRLDPGEYTIGDTAGARVPVADCGVTLGVRVAMDATVAIVDIVSDAKIPPVTIEEETPAAQSPWRPGEQLAVGDTLLEAHPTRYPDAAVVTSEDGTGLDYNRPPRLHPAPMRSTFRLPQPPEPPDKPIVQLLVMITLPLIMALGSAMVLGRARYLLLGLLSPVSVLVTQAMQRRTGKQRYQRQLREYEQTVERVTADARAALYAHQRSLRDACPDPATALLLATGPRARLWERRRSDEDFTLLRVGTGRIPSPVVLTDPTEDEHRKDVTWDFRDVPITVSLRDNGVVGIAGSGELTDRLDRWLVGQLALLHSPAELELYLLSMNRGQEEQWAWTRWLPHLRSTNPEVSLGRLGLDADTCARRVAELLALLGARTGGRSGAARPETETDIVVVLDGARQLRALPGVIQLLRDGPAAGIHVLCFDTEERLLPEECQAVVTISGGEMRFARTKNDSVDEIRIDAPPRDWADRAGRALAPVRDTSTGDEGGAVPRSARLLDVLGLEPPDGDLIAAHWAANGRSTIAAIGDGIDGAFSVDIRKDGPHALIAGTTGSGKSELLQTLVASLAAVNRPEAMSFVLVDYKGGSAFKDCVSLPHTVGMVTDLDAHLVTRALTSLGAELHRREHMLAAAGAKDIEDYTAMFDRGDDLAPMPRLLLVIDEFASLARELPEFVNGLVNIAQRGRSLGIHLVLATQRPAGVITNDIRANTNLRIALRMTDPGESRDVIDSQEAAQISLDTPGRGYARLGHASLLPFQSGRVGGQRVTATIDAQDPAPHILRWDDFARPAPADNSGDDDSGDVDVTDLTVLVSAIQEATSRVGAHLQPSPWLEALPERATLAHVNQQTPMRRPEPGTLQPVPVGIMDLPEQQAQRQFTLDLATVGNLHIVGSGRSGRSEALRTIAGALAVGHQVCDLHMYAIDCGNGTLLPMSELPHCGAVATRTQEDRVVRLVGLLTEELDQRQRTLADRGCADLAELRERAPAAERPAHIVVFLDRWDVFDQTFAEYNHGALIEDLVTLQRDGAGVGMHVIATGDKTLTRSKVAQTTEHRLALRFNDRNDYSPAGLRARDLPDEIPNGRAFRTGAAAEIQLALLADDPSGAAQAAELSRIGGFTTTEFADTPGPRPLRVDVLPDRLGYTDADGYRAADTRRPLWAMVGVGGNQLTAYGADLADTPTFLVGGPPRSGRSSLLRTMSQSLLDAGTELMLITPRTSALAELRDQPGVRVVLDDADPSLRDFISGVQQLDGDTSAIVVDDAELLLSSDIGKEFTRIARGMVGEGFAIIAAGNTEALQGGFNSWHVQLKRNRIGALLSPQTSSDGEILGLRLPKGVPAKRVVLGTAHLHLGDGQVTQVRVPMP